MIKQISILLAISLGGVLNLAVASSASVPNTFTSGTPAVAAEVNSNFTALQNAVNDNDSRLTAVETGVISVNLSGLTSTGDRKSVV